LKSRRNIGFGLTGRRAKWAIVNFFTMLYALCAMLSAVFSFQFRIPNSLPTAGRRNPKSAFGAANFFMDDTGLLYT
jgi:hypothetical protein